MTRPEFEFPKKKFTAVDLALALGKSKPWAEHLIRSMEDAEIVRRMDDGTFQWTFWRREHE